MDQGLVEQPDPIYGWHGVGWVYRYEHIGLEIPECVVGVMYVCPGPQDVATPTADTSIPAAPSRADAQAIVREILASLQLDRPLIHLGPEPSVNEWNMAVVGYPLWLWTSEPATKHVTVTRYGYTFRLTARRTAVLFDMGDRSAQFTCTHLTPYPGTSALGRPSPDCGYTYKTPSLPAGSYAVRATGVWEVDWTAMGYSGTVPVRLTQARSVRVGELQSVREQ